MGHELSLYRINNVIFANRHNQNEWLDSKESTKALLNKIDTYSNKDNVKIATIKELKKELKI